MADMGPGLRRDDLHDRGLLSNANGGKRQVHTTSGIDGKNTAMLSAGMFRPQNWSARLGP